MLTAEFHHIPTLNGTDSMLPPGWNLNGYREPDYDGRVRAYIAANHLSGVCRLDFRAMRWGLPDGAPPGQPSRGTR